ncbi:MAG: hypothetical protein RLN85_18460, partial [Pseudomonadales bacterium]
MCIFAKLDLDFRCAKAGGCDFVLAKVLDLDDVDFNTIAFGNVAGFKFQELRSNTKFDLPALFGNRFKVTIGKTDTLPVNPGSTIIDV